MKAGILEKANSKYNSPIFCIPKKDSMGLRVVLDYRLLNHKSVPDKYSIRTIDQCLEDIGRAKSKIFSCLDLTNGYWQLMMNPQDKHLTASFSRLMDLIMQGARYVITYIDDVLVHSSNHAEHILSLIHI